MQKALIIIGILILIVGLFWPLAKVISIIVSLFFKFFK